MKMTLARRVKAALSALGRKPNDIADALAERKIKGRLYEPKSCPVANYLAQLLRIDDEVSVGNKEIYVTSYNYASKIPIPKPIERFIAKFDEQAYPDLVR